MRRLCIHKNIPISGTKLTLGLWVGFISSHLPADKLFPANPRAITGPPKMSLLLEAKSMPALIIKPTLILVARQQQQMFIQTSTGLSADQVLPQGRSCIAPETKFQLLMGVCWWLCVLSDLTWYMVFKLVWRDKVVVYYLQLCWHDAIDEWDCLLI